MTPAESRLLVALADLLNRVTIYHEMQWSDADYPKEPQWICRNECLACERERLMEALVVILQEQGLMTPTEARAFAPKLWQKPKGE